MNVTSQTKDGKTSLILSGRFDFTAHRTFKQAYEEVLANDAVKELILDLNGVEYLDSSALGMLLILRDRAKESAKRISLGSCSGSVKEVLRVANFDKLFAAP